MKNVEKIWGFLRGQMSLIKDIGEFPPERFIILDEPCLSHREGDPQKIARKDAQLDAAVIEEYETGKYRTVGRGCGCAIAAVAQEIAYNRLLLDYSRSVHFSDWLGYHFTGWCTGHGNEFEQDVLNRHVNSLEYVYSIEGKKIILAAFLLVNDKPRWERTLSEARQE